MMTWIILELARESLWSLFWWGVVYPAAGCLTAPFILLTALFLRRPYRRAVLEMSDAVHAICVRGFWLLA
jgi:hypothetical protein